ncbi:MAG: recombination mediator RecR [Gammaproteobacteria bacterium]|nr:MAG: recombination mediator RecR [Gammaproteobacteria bacterium]
MSGSSLVNQLIEALRCLPGVGPKSAQRMAYYLLQRDRKGAENLSVILDKAVKEVGNCTTCRSLSEQTVCDLCTSSNRDRTMLCIVESPADVQIIEQSTDYKGLFFVLMGHLSPLDGIGPEEIGLGLLANRLDQGEVKEVVLATNFTVEGEATAHYISEMVNSRNITASRIAHGVPVGGELEFVNSTTLSRAFSSRQVF